MSLPYVSSITLIRRVFEHLSIARKQQLVLLGILMVICSLLEAISVSSILPFIASLISPETLQKNAILKPILDQFHVQSSLEMRLAFTLLFVSLILISGLCRILYFWLQIRLSMAIGTDLSVQSYANTLHQPYIDIISSNSSEMLAGAQKAKELVGYIILPALVLLSSFFMLVAVLSPFFIIEPFMALMILLGFGALYALSATLGKRFLKVNSQVYAKELGQVNKVIQEGIGGIRDVIINGAQDTYANAYRLVLSRMQAASAGNVMVAQMPRYVIEMLGITLLAGVAFLMTGHEGGVITAIPVLAVAALGAQKVLPVLQQAYAAYATIRGATVSILDALELLDKKTITSSTSAVKPLSFDGTIKVENLYFRYQKNSKNILSGINLHINKGQRIGFIGATGSGKSTLLDLLMGLLTPTSGSIFIDGQRLCFDNMKSWHSCISHVPQTIFLADTTITENIAFGVRSKDINMERVREAARIAQIAETIECMPEDYQSYVGERGVRLSGGQKQRIGLARALYKRSSILILDEATSALDGETENHVMSEIDSLPNNVTILLIAHRISTLKNCDTIIELHNGTVRWDGSYNELLLRLQA